MRRRLSDVAFTPWRCGRCGVRMETVEDATLHRQINRLGPTTCLKVKREAERQVVEEAAKRAGHKV